MPRATQPQEWYTYFTYPVDSSHVATHAKTGMDAVFLVCKNTNIPMYVDLLEEWNQFSNDEIDKWLADKTFNKYNRQNFQMSGTYLQSSIRIDLWRALEQRLQGQYEGPRIFVAIVQKHQVIGPLIGHKLIAKIQAMSLQEECGKHGGKDLLDLQPHLQNGLGQWDPSWLTWNLCMCVFEPKTMTFNVVMTNILLYSWTKTATWNKVLKHAIDKYQVLAKGKNCKWIMPQEHKEDPTIKAMQAKIKSLEGLLSWKTNDKDKSSNADDKDKHKNITCRKCKKKGHITKNCPDKRRKE